MDLQGAEVGPDERGVHVEGLHGQGPGPGTGRRWWRHPQGRSDRSMTPSGREEESYQGEQEGFAEVGEA
ncbi:hypothetical protein ACFV20_17250 [Streptomyces sp. NPDC059696]|uniref:hypothetical protein n=1 Tax=Streptomyces sp. NPDC059696 TaxID=3346911 RepID=UPI00368969FE